jgi:ElaB/YqjD/DUF883 family membrane-anchored ribosome-binding protein
MFSRVSRRPRAKAHRAAKVLNQHPAEVVNEEVRILISTVDDLIERLSETADPELRRLRTQAEKALAGTKAAVAEGGAQALDRAQELGESYLRERPWSSLGLVALCALAIGLWTGRAVMSD